MEDSKPMTDVERKRYERQQQIAILKAQNEMLRQSKEQAMSRYKDDPYTMSKKAEEFDNMIGENVKMAQNYLGATENELDKAQYHGPNEQGVREYEERLKLHNVTDEQVRNKSAYGNAYETEVAEKRKTRRKSKKSNERIAGDSDSEVSVDEHRVMEQYITPISDDVRDNSEANSAKPAVKDIKKAEGVGNKTFASFDPSTIPDYVQYDMIPLPSKGECYPHKKSRVPVAYLTASDENLIASPNMYRDGSLSDIIVQRKILDKDFSVENMCKGDIDAVLVWLRATGYGSKFPIVATNRETGKKYNTTVDLSKLDYLDFDLKGDENGLFTYTGEDGTVFKFRVMTRGDQKRLSDIVSKEYTDKYNAYMTLLKLEDELSEMDFEYADDVREDIDDLKLNIGDFKDEEDMDVYTKDITEQMIIYTESVNGNSDREYVRGYIENMRAGEARKYREYVNSHQPGVDFNITVNIPESDGGGSFESFLVLDKYVFLNV